MKEIIASGHKNDFAYLSHCLNGMVEGKGVAFSFIIPTPPPDQFDQQATKRLKSWLETMGFQEDLHGDKAVLKLPHSKIAELKRSVYSLSSRERASSQESLLPSFCFAGAATPAAFDYPDIGSTRRRAASANEAEIVPPSSQRRVVSTRARSTRVAALSVIAEQPYKPTAVPPLKAGAHFTTLRSRVLSDDPEESPRSIMSPSPLHALHGRDTPTFNGPEDEDIDQIFPQLGDGLNNLALDLQMNAAGFRPIGYPALVGNAIAANAIAAGSDAANLRPTSSATTQAGSSCKSPTSSIGSDDSTDLDEQDEAGAHLYDPDTDLRPLSPPAVTQSDEGSQFAHGADHFLKPRSDSIGSTNSIALQWNSHHLVASSGVPSRPLDIHDMHYSCTKPPLQSRQSGGNTSMMAESPFALAFNMPGPRENGAASGGARPSDHFAPLSSSAFRPSSISNRDSMDGDFVNEELFSMRNNTSGRSSGSGQFSGRPSRDHMHSSFGKSAKLLRRSKTMPSIPSSRILAGSETPGGCGISMSQGDAGQYRTPQSLRVLKVSGRGENDWGVSLPCPEECITKLIHCLVVTCAPTAGESKPPLLRAYSDEDIDYFHHTLTVNKGVTPPSSSSNKSRQDFHSQFQPCLLDNTDRTIQRTVSMPLSFGYPALHSAEYNMCVAGGSSGFAQGTASSLKAVNARATLTRIQEGWLGSAQVNSSNLDGRGTESKSPTDRVGCFASFVTSRVHPTGVPLRGASSRAQGALNDNSVDSHLDDESFNLAQQHFLRTTALSNSPLALQQSSFQPIEFGSVGTAQMGPSQQGGAAKVLGLGSLHLSRTARAQRKAKQSNAKLRRMSMAFGPRGSVGVPRARRMSERDSDRMSISEADDMLGFGTSAAVIKDSLFAPIVEGDESSPHPYHLFDSSMSPAVHAKRGMSLGRRRRTSAGESRHMSNLADRAGLHQHCESMRDDDTSGADMSVTGVFDMTQPDCPDSFHMCQPSYAQKTSPNGLALHPSVIHLHPAVQGLNERSFKGVVIGGTYQMGFDDYAPLVAAPLGSERRVLGVRLDVRSTQSGQIDSASSAHLELKIYSPLTNEYIIVQLGCGWRYMRAAPVGYIVLAEAVSVPMMRPTQCYFLPRHPFDWPAMEEAAHFGSVGSSNLRVSTLNIQDMNLHASSRFQSFGSLGDELGSRTNSQEWMFGDDFGAPQNTVQLSRANSNISSSSSSFNAAIAWSADNSCNNMVVADQSPEQGGILATMCVNAAAIRDGTHSHQGWKTIPDWNTPAIVTCVLEFLLGESGKGGSVGAKPRGRPARSTRSRNAEHVSFDASSYRLVSRAWCLGSYRLLARHLSSPTNSVALNYGRWAKFVSQNGWGKYISSGACKRVYCVHNSQSGLLEAVSIMDVEDLSARGMDDALERELEISLSCSSLVTLKICPFLVQVYSLFRSECGVPEALWNSDMPPPIQEGLSRALSRTNSGGSKPGSFADLKALSLPPSVQHDVPVERESAPVLVSVPKKSSVSKGNYQYIRMEFCSGGDIEELVRKERVLQSMTVRNLLFQMCYALYSCREQLQLRHYDIKLLNFFCTNGSGVLPTDMRIICDYRRLQSPFQDFRQDLVEATVECRIWFGHRAYSLPLRISSKCLVKLADFGTSVIGAGGLGDPITVQQFTTLENTPPEYFLLGSAARQAFSADTYMLGLSFLHLLTGHEPYEVLLANVRCPLYLCGLLESLWSPDDPNDQYYIIRQVVESLDFGDEVVDDRGSYGGLLLCDTLYRYLVLFGTQGMKLSREGEDTGSCSIASSRAWRLICDALALEDGDVIPHGSHAAHFAAVRDEVSTREHCALQFALDCQEWSIEHGTQSVIVKARELLREMYFHTNGGRVRPHGGSEGDMGDVQFRTQASDLLSRMVALDPTKRYVQRDQ